MEIQLQQLLDAIRTQGVEKAEQEAEVILERAREEAAKILAEANVEAETILGNAKEETARLERSGKESLKQAGRDLILNLFEQVKKVFESIIREKIEDKMDGKIIETSIVDLIKNWNERRTNDLAVLMKEEDLGLLSSTFYGALADELRNGLKLKPVSGIDAGFRISQDNGALYYDFTAETIAELIAGFLNPSLAGILRETASKELL